MKALVFGEILWDIIEGHPHLGGAPLNFAAHVRKCGGESAIVSCVGADESGAKALRLTREAGVDVSLVQQRIGVKTGYVPVQLINGQPHYEIVKNVAFDYIQESGFDKIKSGGYDIFYFGSLVQRSEVSRKTLYKILNGFSFNHVFYDVNLRKDCYSDKIIKSSFEYCTILKLNDEEVPEISQMLFDRELEIEKFCKSVSIRYKAIKTIIVTAGSKGAFIFDENNLTHVPSEPIDVIDTVGAGDSFSAAFSRVYQATGDAILSAKIANKVGGFVASSAGALPKYSSELEQIIFDAIHSCGHSKNQ